MPKNASTGPRAEDADDRTNPGGPSPEVLAAAQKNEAQAGAPAQASVPDREEAEDDAAVTPGPGDATLVYDKNKRTAGAELPRLLVVGGPRTGSEYTLTELETSIGRGSDNVVVIPDISVSRRHVVIAREGDRYVLIDQRSGNGTRVNGRGVDRHPLESGDDIAMGDTVVRFVEAGGVVVKAKGARPLPAAREAQAASGPAREEPEITSGGTKSPIRGTSAGKGKSLGSRLPLYVAVVGVFIVIFGLAYQHKQKREQQVREAAAAKDEGAAFAQQRFEEGVQLLKDGRWEQARDKLKVAAEMAPQDPDIKRYLQRAEAEAPRAQAIANARAALGRKEFAAVRGLLQGIPDDSALADASRQVAQELKSAMDGAVHDARNKMEDGDAQGASDLVTPVLAADPGRADALAIKDAISGHQRVIANARRERAQEREKAEAQEVKAPPAAVSAIIDAYLSGDIGTAIDKADGQTDPRAVKLDRDLKAFDAAYRDGLVKAQSKQLAEAVHALEGADKLDRSISGGKESRLGKEVRRALGNLHYNLGVQALAVDDQLAAAATHLRYAVADDPENDAAKRQLAEVIAKVKDIYQQGYFEKDSDPDAAKKAFKLVVQALPASDELQQKAKRWLDKLEGKGGE